MSQLDLAPLYARYGTRGSAPYVPEILLAWLFYAYATGTFASRKIEQATQETAFRFLAGNLSPDHDTLAAFRKTFLPELTGLFVQILLLAQHSGFLKLGAISLAEAKIVLQARAAERFAVEHAEYEAKWQQRQDKIDTTGKQPGGKPPAPPLSEPGASEQYNFTDPDSRIMKNSRDGGFSQQYNAQAAVAQESLLSVGASLSNHANDQGEVKPPLAAMAAVIGTPVAAALDPCGVCTC